jgi:lincosamide nucleotidyltransferase A/C/D/E
VDFLLEHRYSELFVAALINDGYQEKIMDYTTPAHSVWIKAGQVLDLHFFVFDDLGGLHYEGEAYPSWILDGRGRIAEAEVLCLTPEAQVLFHQGYEHDENDEHDMRLLCAAFGLRLPDEYAPGKRGR